METPHTLSSYSPFPPPPSPWQPLIRFLSMNLPVLEISNKWNHNIWLGFCHFHNDFKVRLSCSMYQYFFCCWIIIYCIDIPHLSIHQFMDTWVVSTFWLLWIMLLWTCVHKLLCGHMFSVLLSIYLGVSHTVNSMLKFLRNRQTIFHSSSPFYIPTNNISPPPTLGVFHFLFFSFFWLCWVFTAAHGLSLVAATLDCGAWASHCGGFSSWSMSSRHSGFSSCSMRAQ